MFLNREPVLYMGLVEAILAVTLAFGINMSGEQVATIMAVVAAVLSVVVRTKVSPINGNA